MPKQLVTALHHEQIEGVRACKAYSGQAAAILAAGAQVVVLAADRETLNRIARALNHKIEHLDPEAIYPATIVHDANVIREDL